MKTKINIQILSLLMGILLVTAGCEKYEDFVQNEYDFTTVYFAKQNMDRTIVTDEWMRIGVGVMLGGRLENSTEETVTFQLDDALIDLATMERLPDSYFKLVDKEGNETSEISIPAGKHQGFVYVELNQDFIADNQSLTNHYALGFNLTATSVDSILYLKEQTVVTFKYVNTYFGNYYREGMTTRYNVNDEMQGVDEYNRETDGNSAWELETKTPGTSQTNWTNQSGITPQFELVVNEDNTVEIIGINDNPAGTAPGTILSIIDNGGSTYLPDTRVFKVDYTYTFIDNAGVTQKYRVEDNLVFRNRVIDGVNQWFDE